MSEQPPPEDDRTVVRPTQGGASAPGDERTQAAPPPPATAPAPPPARHDSGNALAVGTFLDEFELRAVAGEGGFSIVYRAWDHTLKRQVAVKEYFPSGLAARVGGTQISVRSERHRETFDAGLRSFVEEAQLLAHFDHPALIKVYRFWKANGSAYMVMPFCEGITLRDDWRSKPEAPDEASLLTLLDPLTEALAVMHHENWYHRDVAPDNVMLLAGTRRPLLLDFGAARQVIGDMTHALTVILKPGYAPIEQWGEVPGMKQGPWTDVYALGALIHFGIMRRTPPPSVGRLVNDSYEPLARVAAGRYSQRFLEAVDRTLVVRPEHRTQSIAQFRDESGLNEVVRDRTMTYLPTMGIPTTVMPPPVSPAPAAEDEVAAPTTSSMDPTVLLPPVPAPAPRTDFGAEPTVRPYPPPAAPPKDSRRTMLLVGVGAVAAAAAGIGAWKLLPRADDQVAMKPPQPDTKPEVPGPPPAASQVQPPPPPPPPAVFDAAEEFGKVVKAQTSGFAVEVSLPRATLRSEKDKLAFTVQAQRDGFLYVFNHGSDGSLLQLYPNGLTPQPRVRTGQTLRLPVKEDFTVTGPTGTSELLVIVSALPRDHSAVRPRRDGEFTFYPTGADAGALVRAHTGPLPLMAGTPVCAAGAPCTDEFGAAVVTFNVVN